MASLYDINEGIKFLAAQLEQMDESTPEEEAQLIRQMLEAAEMQREEKIVSVARWRKQLQQEEKEVIGDELKRLRERRQSYQKRVESLTLYLKDALAEVGGRVKTPLGTVCEQNNSKPTVEVTDSSQIPDEFWMDKHAADPGDILTVPMGEYKVQVVDGIVYLAVADKDKIADHWAETGEQVPGTNTTRGTHVQFR